MIFKRGYGVRNVVGATKANKDEYICHAIERTLIEHDQLRLLLYNFAPSLYNDGLCDAVEFGAGYGRMMRALGKNAIGFERDEKLRKIGVSLGYDIRPFPVPDKKWCVGLTFTFLQHLSGEELADMIPNLQKCEMLFLCEEAGAYGESRGCRARFYRIPGYKELHREDRRVEYGAKTSAQYSVLARI